MTHDIKDGGFFFMLIVHALQIPNEGNPLSFFGTKTPSTQKVSSGINNSFFCVTQSSVANRDSLESRLYFLTLVINFSTLHV